MMQPMMATPRIHAPLHAAFVLAASLALAGLAGCDRGADDTASAPVASASSARSMLMRLPSFSSMNMRPPPAPQHSPRSFVRGISTSCITGNARLSVSRGASYTPL